MSSSEPDTRGPDGFCVPRSSLYATVVETATSGGAYTRIEDCPQSRGTCGVPGTLCWYQCQDSQPSRSAAQQIATPPTSLPNQASAAGRDGADLAGSVMGVPGLSIGKTWYR